MARNFIKTLVISTVLVSGISVNSARAENDQFVEFMAATIFMFAMADVLGGNGVTVETTQTHKPRPVPVFPGDRRKLLPDQCRKTHVTQQGKVTVYGKTCLQRNFRYYRALPQYCEQTLWTAKGIRKGYGPACLRRFGYRRQR